MNKVLEKIINIQLYDYFQSNHLLYKSQSGFRKHHSTEFASLELVDTIQQQLDLKLDPFAVFLDTSKEPVCPRVELILKIIIILLIIFLGFIKSKPC